MLIAMRRQREGEGTGLMIHARRDADATGQGLKGKLNRRYPVDVMQADVQPVGRAAVGCTY